MNISKYRVRENLSFYDNNRKSTISGNYIEILFESKKGKFLLPIFILETNNPNAKDTFYSSLGGLSQPKSRKNVVWHDLVFAKFPNAKKIILFSHEYSCLREVDAKSGKLLIKAILKSDIEEIKPEGNIFCMGYSAGIGAIMDFIIEAQRNNSFQSLYSLPKKLLLIDPVGLSPNPSLVFDFFFTGYQSFAFRKKRGLNTRNAITETIKELKGTWMIIGDRFVTFKEIFKDFLLGFKRHLKEEIKFFQFSKIRPIKAPVKLLRKGSLKQKAMKLTGNLEVIILSATYGLDRLTTNYIDFLISEYSIKSKDFFNKSDLNKIESNLQEIFAVNIFSNIKKENILVKIIEATHSMVFYDEFGEEVREKISF